MSIRPFKKILLAPILALLLVGHSFGYVKWADRLWQPAQMWSKVDYDPKLSDPFFDADEWTCENGHIDSAECRNGKWVKILKKPCESSREEPCIELDEEWTCPDGCKECAICEYGRPVVKSTAKCISTSFGVKHRVSFCETKLTGADTIDLFIHTEAGTYNDGLRIQIIDGWFRCQYWTDYMNKTRPDSCLIWTTKHQKLTLDKEVYHTGDLIKGKIEFECIEEPTHPKYIEKSGRHLSTIKVYGVFKAIVQ